MFECNKVNIVIDKIKCYEMNDVKKNKGFNVFPLEKKV